MQLFYNPDLDNSVSQFVFSEEESRHIVKVLRKKKGDDLLVTNGTGYFFNAKILEADNKRCKMEITSSKREHPKRHWLHMVISPTKISYRFEWFLEKATEIGVHEITPIICERSELKAIKIDRMKKLIETAMKQSLQSYLPKLNDAISFKEYISKPSTGLLFIAHCEDKEKMELKRGVVADKDVTVLIGPEGDFSHSEIKLAEEKGFIPISLGKNRLRTETAAIVVCTTVALINNS